MGFLYARLGAIDHPFFLNSSTRKTNFAQETFFFLPLSPHIVSRKRQYHSICPYRVSCSRFTIILAMSHIIDEDETSCGNLHQT